MVVRAHDEGVVSSAAGDSLGIGCARVDFVSPRDAEALADDPAAVHVGYSRQTDHHVEAYVRSA